MLLRDTRSRPVKNRSAFYSNTGSCKSQVKNGCHMKINAPTTNSHLTSQPLSAKAAASPQTENFAELTSTEAPAPPPLRNGPALLFYEKGKTCQ